MAYRRFWIFPPLLIIILLLSCFMVRSKPDDYYVAAVYEHSRIGLEIFDASPATVRANLDWYERATEVARQKGADIILFPEYGIFPPATSRSDIRPFLEVVPNPKEITVNPCADADLFADRPILLALSCIAKSNDIVVVANTGSIEPCEDEPDCPQDGHWQYNANVAFDRNGTLIARYYKERLYFERSMDIPREEQDPIFKTNFGKFATFICFDLIFEKMVRTWHLSDVDAILFSGMWYSSYAISTSTQWFQSWAIGNNATFLAANVQIPGYSLLGSGIFQGRKGSLVHTFNPDGVSKLMVASLPKRNQDISSTTELTAIVSSGTVPVKDEGADVTRICNYKMLGNAKDVYSEYRCVDETLSHYTLRKLEENEGRVGVCSNNMCCEVEYKANVMNESFYLLVFNGTNVVHNKYKWAEENCFFVRCDDINGTKCSNFPTVSETIFYNISLTANFTTPYVYPSFMSNKLKLVPVKDWSFTSKYDTSTIKINNSSGFHIISATFRGRVYERDPPYIR